MFACSTLHRHTTHDTKTYEPHSSLQRKACQRMRRSRHGHRRTTTPSPHGLSRPLVPGYAQPKRRRLGTLTLRQSFVRSRPAGTLLLLRRLTALSLHVLHTCPVAQPTENHGVFTPGARSPFCLSTACLYNTSDHPPPDASTSLHLPRSPGRPSPVVHPPAVVPAGIRVGPRVNPSSARPCGRRRRLSAAWGTSCAPAACLAGALTRAAHVGVGAAS